MTRLNIIDDVEYPESDGRPVGETDLHIDWIFRIRELLRYRYRGQRVYVACDLLLYYEKGNTDKVVVPDHFVVKDCDPGMRRTYKLWEEGKVPNVAFEVTSKRSRITDTRTKPLLYAKLGIKEYFIYDPTSAYLRPPLQGFQHIGEKYARIEPDSSGALESHELSLRLRFDEGKLVLIDSLSGKPLLTEAETLAAEVRTAEARAAQAEAELKRLRDELRGQ